MSINWTKTNIQDLGGCDAPCQRVSVQGNEVEVVESFVYLGSLIHCSGGSELEIKRRATFVRESMLTFDQNIWSSSISLAINLWLYNVCILLIFLYGSDVKKVKVKVEHLYSAPSRRTATSEALRYMGRTKQRRTYLPYTFPAVAAGTHLATPRGWRVE